MPLNAPPPDPRNPGDPLARLEQSVARLGPAMNQGVWESGNRLGLLWVHAVTGLVAGTLILVNGTAISLTQVLPDAQLLTGVPAIVGGVVLAAGLATRPRRIFVEVAGLVILAAWDLVMAVGFIRGGLSPHVPTRWYPVAIYAGYFALISVHLWTLRSIWRANRRQATL